MVEIKNLTKKYGDIVAINDISFTANEGEILGFLGPNGAGKSTTMNIITGYISSTNGTVTIDGSEILEDPKTTKAKIGYLPEIPPLYQDMTVYAYLKFMFELKKVKLPKEEHINEVMEIVGVDQVKDRLIKNLSKGYKQRVGFAQALLGNPPVLILDEPTVGLDPKQIIEIRNLIKSLGKKHTVIFSSHVLSEVAAICDRIIIISNGEIVADAKADELSNTIRQEGIVEVEIEGASSTVTTTLNNISGVKKVTKGNNNYYYVEHEVDTDIRKQIFREISKTDCMLLTMKKGGLSLEESFLKLTEQGRKGGKN